ncbi:unnamed protein product, partial [Laminaria digitata]
TGSCCKRVISQFRSISDFIELGTGSLKSVDILLAPSGISTTLDCTSTLVVAQAHNVTRWYLLLLRRSYPSGTGQALTGKPSTRKHKTPLLSISSLLSPPETPFDWSP